MSRNATLQAIQHIRPLGRHAHTHLFLCTGDCLCVVKLLDRSQQRRHLSGIIATRLARSLGLPTPETVLVEIPDILLRTIPKLPGQENISKNQPVALHLATHYAGTPCRQLVDILPDALLRNLENRDAFTQIFALDQWSSHAGPPGAVFFRSTPGSGYCVEFIKRCAAFSGPELKFRDQAANGVYDRFAVYAHVRGWDSFDPFLSSLILTSPETLWGLTRDLPFGWSDEYADELDFLVHGLLRRRSLIRQLIAKSRDQIAGIFPQWTRRAFVPTQAAWFENIKADGAKLSPFMKNLS